MPRGWSLNSVTLKCAFRRAQGPPLATVGLFSHLIERADARAVRVSSFADRFRIAGEVCERYADALTE